MLSYRDRVRPVDGGSHACCFSATFVPQNNFKHSISPWSLRKTVKPSSGIIELFVGISQPWVNFMEIVTSALSISAFYVSGSLSISLYRLCILFHPCAWSRLAVNARVLRIGCCCLPIPPSQFPHHERYLGNRKCYTHCILQACFFLPLHQSGADDAPDDEEKNCDPTKKESHWIKWDFKQIWFRSVSIHSVVKQSFIWS